MRKLKYPFSHLYNRKDWLQNIKNYFSMKRRDTVLTLLKDKELSCRQLSDLIIEVEGLEKSEVRSVSNSLSSLLPAMVFIGLIEYSDKKTSRGGYIYKL